MLKAQNIVALACALTVYGGVARSAQLTALGSDAVLIANGQKLFTHVWSVNEGLGPQINARSCVGCHAVPSVGGSGGSDDRAFVTISPLILDPSGGHVFRRLRVSIKGAVTEQASPAISALRRAPSLFGSGALESLSHADIISSVPTSIVLGRVPEGRFGWKGRLKNLDEAVAAAFANELGLSSLMFPETAKDGRVPSPPEVSTRQIAAVAAYIRALPPMRGEPLSDSGRGRELFQHAGCTGCHRPTFPTLEARRMFPYTDLLLHDMGPALADWMQEGVATGTEFKTPSLWGLARTGPPYLHDGRAKTLQDAILAHAGEAHESAIAYQRLTPAEQATVLAFLRSL